MDEPMSSLSHTQGICRRLPDSVGVHQCTRMYRVLVLVLHSYCVVCNRNIVSQDHIYRTVVRVRGANLNDANSPLLMKGIFPWSCSVD